ncbi:heterokaryon incompatibility protein-domain-containing protein [Cercophora scortea]|uniref:Heterokaryon incompatibility protein-domain-containing protein n=1 Tax=Cercophora scortea TaxID=314031 RepID=A0AAE0MA35_9PEZI|nr:heterokaryon incompatibility protein-domain-containing protein [Cercophora scortea]
MVTTRSKFASHKRHASISSKQDYPRLEALASHARLNHTAIATRSVDHYTYNRLQDGSRDIRLITLVPGADHDPILVHITHTQIPDYDESASSSSSSSQTLKEIEANLPPGWAVYETWEGPLIYVNKELDTASWRHPSSQCRDDPGATHPRTTVQDVPGTPVYEALSYTWGSSHSKRAIFVQDPQNNTRTKLLVTKSLAIALHHLRYHDKPRTLWVDAICINQQDIPERNAQVPRMTHLYRLAHRVVVWLGPGSRQSTVAISSLRYLGDQVQLTRQNHTIRMPGAAEKDWYVNSHDIPYDEETWRAILRLFQRVWFTRVWVVQEINLANARAVVQCGGDCIPWVVFRRAVLCLSTKFNLPSQELRSEVASICGLATYDRAAAYSDIAISLFDRRCFDQRDRVYGLLGLMSAGLRKRIPADYSLPVEEVYKRATLAQITHFGRLDPLRGCFDTADPRAITAPSWVPDLILPPPGLQSVRRQFSAGLSPCVARYVEPDILEVHGVQVGVVSAVEPKISDNLWAGLEAVRQWKFEDLNRAYPGGGFLLEAVAWTLSGLRLEERYPWMPRIPDLDEWKDYCQTTLLLNDDEAESPQEKGRVSALYMSAVQSLLHWRTLFHTADGHVGLCPDGIQCGDIVTIMLGYDAPMVLREKADGTYHVVGESMAYGFHDAICLLGAFPTPWSVQVSLDSTGDASLYRFFNAETGQLTEEDPRLEPLRGWERFDMDRTADDPEVFQKFRNLSTGEVINYDPRMSPDALEARGVAMTTFRLS